MKKCLFLILLFPGLAEAQPSVTYLNFEITNHQSALPFGKFSQMIAGPFHPGFKIGFGRTFSERKKHEWTRELKWGYFYHRFVQHGIPVYVQLGYSYKPNSRFTISPAIGAGYLHSIPASGVLKLQSGGTYRNAKGIGRGQAMLNLSLGTGFSLTKNNRYSPRVFFHYDQQLQLPFVRSYVPVLPYNVMSAGFTLPVNKK